MRLKLSRFRRNFNKDLPIEFTEQNLSSFGGLELFSRYLRRVELSRRVGKACRGLVEVPIEGVESFSLGESCGDDTAFDGAFSAE